MSVFFKNICPYENCAKNFHTLSDLIIHIEGEHLDFDPSNVEELEQTKPECLPLSYVFKYSTPDDAPPEVVSTPRTSSVIEEINLNNNLSCDLSNQKVTRVNTEENSIFQMFRNHKLFTLDNKHKKPFACNISGCEKRYKNINGIKYHFKKHHKMNEKSNNKTSLLKVSNRNNSTSNKMRLNINNNNGRCDNNNNLWRPFFIYKPHSYPVLGANYNNCFQECKFEGNENLQIHKSSTNSRDLLFYGQTPSTSTKCHNYQNLFNVNFIDNNCCDDKMQ